jgi:anthranilate synthase/aminodeoxychorismate synthase-like glutamine amidotransferase
MKRLLLIDNYDSFTYNLAHGFAALGVDVTVARNDQIDTTAAVAMRPTHLVISPGPGRPVETGISRVLIETFHGQIPILGVCLGHQLIAELYGGRVAAADRIVHGKAGVVVRVADDPLLAGLGDTFDAGRYHSLIACDPLPDALMVTARSDDGEVMALRHRSAPTHGVQFHPESILTPTGPTLLANFVALEAA